jgi:putative transposase
MKADMGRRYRLYPSQEQAERLLSWGHTCRAVWNLALAQRRYVWTQRGETLRAVEQSRQLTLARAELPWLADLPAQSAQQVLRHLDRAYDNWWNPKHPAGPPRFKKRGTRLSVSFPGQAVAVRRLNRRWAQVWLPKLGWVRFRLSRPLGGTLRNATISRDGLGWHVGSVWPQMRSPPHPTGCLGAGGLRGGVLGVRLRRARAARHAPSTLTVGERRRLLGLERRRARQLRWAKRHNQGRYSRRLRHTIAEIAKLRAQQARRRADFTHKLTTDLAKRHGWVAIEELRVAAMTASATGSVEVPGRNVKGKAGLTRSILDNTPGERRRQLAYKAPRFGSQLRLVPAAGTSQTCAACGHRDPTSRPGLWPGVRVYRLRASSPRRRQCRQDIEALAAGWAVDSTRSHPLVARSSGSRMREPLGSTA